jgi:hypothetical protein
MRHHINVEKKLHLRFKGSDRKTKNLIISRPKDNLKKVVANMAMDDIVEANLFEKDGVQLYEGRRDAYYKTRRVDVFL